MKSHKINKFFERYAAFLLKWRWAAIALFTVVLLVSFYGMSKMVQQTSFDDYFIEGDPMLVKTEEFKAHFGNDYFVGVLTDCDDHFTKENLALLRELGNELLDSLSYADVRDLGVFNRLSVDWAATDQIHAMLGYDYCYARGGMFTRYAHNSEVWVKLKYNF